MFSRHKAHLYSASYNLVESAGKLPEPLSEKPYTGKSFALAIRGPEA
jgi:hypothetical protein